MALPTFRAAVFLTAALLCFHLCHPGLLWAGQDGVRASQIQQGGYALAVNGRLTTAQNSNTAFIPASTLKLVTSLAALDILGPDHRFATRIFHDQQNNLYIQGSGDPFLLTENVTTIARKLHDTGIRQINNLILDESAFVITTQADGNDNTTNPYDAWNSGLAVNFNSIAIQVGPDRAVAADDPKVPFLPIMKAIGASLPPGHHLVNVNAFATTGQLSNTQRYTGELFAALLEKEQMTIRGTILTGLTPAQATPILTYWSDKTVRDMLQQCLKYSNNFIANQLFLACGAAQLGVPATWDKARVTLQAYIRENLGIPEPDLVMVEGSGLSRRNRITPVAMITILQKFAPHQELLPVKNGIPLKSGTLTGVYCYAGYLPDQSHTPFTILLNQPQNNRDEILQLLLAKHQGPAATTPSRRR